MENNLQNKIDEKLKIFDEEFRLEKYPEFYIGRNEDVIKNWIKSTYLELLNEVMEGLDNRRIKNLKQYYDIWGFDCPAYELPDLIVFRTEDIKKRIEDK